MSRFYEALSREEQKLKLREQAGGIDSEGDGTVLGGIEESFSVSTNGTKRKSEEPPLSTVEEIPARPGLPCRLSTSETDETPEALTRNSFRPLSVLFREDSRISFHDDPDGLAADQFRLLRRTLNQDFGTGAVVMITSPGLGDGKTLTSLNLCTCLADSGDPTLLVEADVRRAMVARILGCAIEPPGIEDVWAGKVEPWQAIRLIEGLSFHAAMVAKIPEDPFHLLNGTAVKRFLAWAQQHFRWVVLDAAAVLPAADVCELLPLTDAVLLVIRAQNTSRELSKRAIEVLGKRVHGVIFNEATIDSNPYFRYLK